MVRRVFVAVVQRVRGRATVSDRVRQYGAVVAQRLAPAFRAAGVPYPPAAVVLIGLKEERLLQVWVSDDRESYTHLKDYPVLGASGGPGPKLKEGDNQVPEGLYRIESLNPNSMFHLSLRLNYPNPFDRERGREDGRIELGTDIMIHGNDCSAGCLAMGDEAAEDLFVLAAETGIDNIRVILSPADLRKREAPSVRPGPAWLPELYEQVKAELTEFAEGEK